MVEGTTNTLTMVTAMEELILKELKFLKTQQDDDESLCDTDLNTLNMLVHIWKELKA